VTRSLYRHLVWLHPPAFRQKFAEEMLWIFDETTEARRAPAVRRLSHFIGSAVAGAFRSLETGAATCISSLLFFGLGYAQKSSLDEASAVEIPGGIAGVPARSLVFALSEMCLGLSSIQAKSRPVRPKT
jgi:hypothetical protein